MREYAGTINGSNCLVADTPDREGAGLDAWDWRKGLVGARRTSDLAWIELFGYQAIKTDDICDQDQYDLIFNTIPAMVLTEECFPRRGKAPF